MAIACRRERLLLPTTPAINKPHSSDSGHQIHFARPDEPARDRPEPQPILGEGDVVLVQDLRDRVVAIDVKHHFIATKVLDVDELVSAQPCRGDASLDDEDAVAGEMSGCVFETPHLTILGEEVVDGIEDQVDQWVPIAWGRCAFHVAHRHVDLVAIGLVSDPTDHVRRQFDPIDADAALGEWDRDTTGTDRELERRTTTRETSEKVDGLGLVATEIFVITL